MDDLPGYLTEIQLGLVGSPIILEYQVTRSQINIDDGYIRIRAILINGDFLEASEYFVLTQNQIETVDYRYQWMDSTKTQLRRRWDNTPHHPGIDNFPHHIHDGSETSIRPGHSLSVLALLKILEGELGE